MPEKGLRLGEITHDTMRWFARSGGSSIRVEPNTLANSCGGSCLDITELVADQN
jgi:hypothetical protein